MTSTNVVQASLLVNEDRKAFLQDVQSVLDAATTENEEAIAKKMLRVVSTQKKEVKIKVTSTSANSTSTSLPPPFRYHCPLTLVHSHNPTPTAPQQVRNVVKEVDRMTRSTSKQATDRDERRALLRRAAHASISNGISPYIALVNGGCSTKEAQKLRGPVERLKREIGSTYRTPPRGNMSMVSACVDVQPQVLCVCVCVCVCVCGCAPPGSMYVYVCACTGCIYADTECVSLFPSQASVPDYISFGIWLVYRIEMSNCPTRDDCKQRRLQAETAPHRKPPSAGTAYCRVGPD